MNDPAEYIDKGLLHAYILGLTTAEENEEVELLATKHEAVRKAIETFETDLESYARANAVAPDPTLKPFLIAAIDYSERIERGEAPAFPPELNETSSIQDYAEWLDRANMQPPAVIEDFFAKIIKHEPGALTAIVWIKDMAPPEVHDDEFEKFLIVEGTCDIFIEDEVNHLTPGEFLKIPLHKTHRVKVTSDIPCKVILQRIAA